MIATELAFKVEIDGTGRCATRVLGPQLGEALAHCLEGVLHCARLDQSLAGGKAPIMVALGEDLKEEDGVGNIGESFIGAKQGLGKRYTSGARFYPVSGIIKE
jgi:hypothetical protein